MTTTEATGIKKYLAVYICLLVITGCSSSSAIRTSRARSW